MVNINYKISVEEQGCKVDDSGDITDREGQKLGKVLNKGVQLMYDQKDPEQSLAVLGLRRKLYEENIPLKDCPKLKDLRHRFKNQEVSYTSVIGSITDILLADSLEKSNAQHRREFQNA